jgi:hypothetical protein
VWSEASVARRLGVAVGALKYYLDRTDFPPPCLRRGRGRKRFWDPAGIERFCAAEGL